MEQTVGRPHTEADIRHGRVTGSAALVADVAEIHVIEIKAAFCKSVVDSVITVTVISKIAGHGLRVRPRIDNDDHRLSVRTNPAADIRKGKADSRARASSGG